MPFFYLNGLIQSKCQIPPINYHNVFFLFAFIFFYITIHLLQLNFIYCTVHRLAQLVYFKPICQLLYKPANKWVSSCFSYQSYLLLHSRKIKDIDHDYRFLYNFIKFVNNVPVSVNRISCSFLSSSIFLLFFQNLKETSSI